MIEKVVVVVWLVLDMREEYALRIPFCFPSTSFFISGKIFSALKFRLGLLGLVLAFDEPDALGIQHKRNALPS